VKLGPSLARVEPPSSVRNEDDKHPDLSRNLPPAYPATAIERRWEGTVLLRIRIDKLGRVTNVSVARTSGYPLLDSAAATAVRQWRGVPARRGGQAVATVEVLPVQFKL
jgi:protein TonB